MTTIEGVRTAMMCQRLDDELTEQWDCPCGWTLNFEYFRVAEHLPTLRFHFSHCNEARPKGTD